MATTVLLEVAFGADANPYTTVAPPSVLSAVTAAGQPTGHGWCRRGNEAWRLRFHLTGPDRVTVGRALEIELRRQGYVADLSIGR